MNVCTNKMLRNLAVLSLAFVMTGTALAEKGIFTKRYVFFLRGWSTNQAAEENTQIMERAAKAGYNGLIFGNYGLSVMHKKPKTDPFLTRFAEFRAQAKKNGLTLCPNYAYQTMLPHHSITASEAFPVRGTPFVVEKDGRAVVETDANLDIANGSFEEIDGLLPSGWKIAGLAPGTQMMVDTCGRTGKRSVRFQDLPPQQANCGIKQTIAVKPLRAYEIRVWIKTKDFVNRDPSSPRFHPNPATVAQVAVYGNTWKHWVNMLNGGQMWPKQGNVRPTQGWKEYRMVFGSVSNSSISIRIQPVGYHCAPKGNIWFDDISIREVGLVETMMRSTTPVIVKDAVSGTVYQEGVDYLLDAKTDYMAVGKLSIPAGSVIKAGQRLLVDWSILADQINRFPSGAWCNKQAFQYLIEDNLLLHELTGGLGAYHIATGEWRDAGWDPTCMDLYGTAGNYMAGATLGLEATCRLFNPKMDVYIKNDMYDPYQNANLDRRQYYLCNGPIYGSWNGISDSAIVMNWRPSAGAVGSSENLQVKSFLFWAGLDPEVKITPKRQIVRFNCQSGNLHGVDKGLANIAAAEALGMTGMVGCVYNTWDGRYPAFEAMEELAQLCTDHGRWGTNPCPLDNGCDAVITLDSAKLVPPPLGIENVHASGHAPKPLGVNVHLASSNTIFVDYSLGDVQNLDVCLYNIHGQEIRRWWSGREALAGSHKARFDATGIPAGIYFLQLAATGKQGGVTESIAAKVSLF